MLLSVAGFDPSSGAGLTRDLITWNMMGMEGMAVMTANTVQTSNAFVSMNAVAPDILFSQIDHLFTNQSFDGVKIGLFPHTELFEELLIRIHNHHVKYIVWDPILSISANRHFSINWKEHVAMAKNYVTHFTPNVNEWNSLMTKSMPNYNTCVTVIKSYEKVNDSWRDVWMENGAIIAEVLNPQLPTYNEKHGTGCVFSATLTAALVQGFDKAEALRIAARNVRAYMLSSQTKQGHQLHLE